MPSIDYWRDLAMSSEWNDFWKSTEVDNFIRSHERALLDPKSAHDAHDVGFHRGAIAAVRFLHDLPGRVLGIEQKQNENVEEGQGGLTIVERLRRRPAPLG